MICVAPKSYSLFIVNDTKIFFIASRIAFWIIHSTLVQGLMRMLHLITVKKSQYISIINFINNMNKKYIISFAFLALFLAAPLAFLSAQAVVDTSYISSWITTIAGLITQLIPLMIAIGVLYFIWGLVSFIASADDEAARASAKMKMVWGIVALFVIVGVWGFVALLQQFTGVDDTTAASTGPATPAIPAP